MNNNKLDIQDTIDESGCQIMIVEGSEYLPSYAYTIGLYQQYNHPEIICFGLLPSVMQSLLNQIKNCLEEKEEFEPNKDYKGFLQKDVPICFIAVDKIFYAEYLNSAIEFYGNDDFPCLQLIWPDKKLRFPWDKNFNPEFKNIQPLLDRDTDFFFYEDKNLMIFTTENVLKKKKPISYVCHDDEGDWFFLEDESVEGDELINTSLGEIVALHPELNKFYSLDYGWESFKNTETKEWEDEKMELL